MTTTGNERYWGIVAPLMPAGTIAEAAKQQEDTGLLGTFAAQVYGPPWTALAAAATTTTRLQLASGIAQAFVRSPFETAMKAMDLDRISGGRFVLGLGPTVRSWSEGAYGVPGYGRPLAHLREVVEVIRCSPSSRRSQRSTSRPSGKRSSPDELRALRSSTPLGTLRGSS